MATRPIHVSVDTDMQTHRRLLPISPARGQLLKEIRTNHCCVVVGETGSGKTTQIPQYLLEAGFSKRGGVAVTQPRRVAATSIARRVAEERGVALGGEVGYSVRFDDCSSSKTRLKFMTDGMLLREAILDPLLSRYGVVILDEAHERTVHTDLLFGVVKAAQASRARQLSPPRLRIIVMSATLAAEEFSSYFNTAKILYIQGRQFPVSLHYTLTPQSDYVNSAITTVLQLHREEVDADGASRGDVLVFLTGREEIEGVSHTLNKCREMFPSDWLDMEVCPLFAALPWSQQQKVFRATAASCRKVILSTNIAETSITIPGVCYVVDTGVVKARGYNPHIGLDMLTVQPVSKAQARQRTGRAGREAAGHCYRLYTQEHFEELREDTVPEIQRCHLSSVVLQLLALGVSNITTFDFMSPPPRDALLGAVEQLYLLGAVEKDEVKMEVKKTEEEDGVTQDVHCKAEKKRKKKKKRRRERSEGDDMQPSPLERALPAKSRVAHQEEEEEQEDFSLQLTPLGRTLSHFPLEPHLACAIVTSPPLGCTHEVLSIVAMLSVDSVTFAPRDKKERVEAVHRKFVSGDGDHVTLLNMYRAYKTVKGSKAWCKENFIHIRNMATVLDIRRQLSELCERVGVAVASGGVECSENVRRALLAGLFVNVAEHVGEGKYKTLSSRQEVFIHPTSTLFHTKPHPFCVMYSELVFTTKCYMRGVSIIDPAWLEEAAPPHYSKRLLRLLS